MIPDCDYRHATDGERFFCAHPRVHAPGSLVTADQCGRCIWHSVPCEPRHVPADLSEAALLASEPRRERPKPRPPCLHLGQPTGGNVACESCKGIVRLVLYGCEVNGQCVIGRKVDGVACCNSCDQYQPRE